MLLLNVPCKAGKLQVDEGVLRVAAPFNKVVWQVPTGSITRIIAQQSGFTYTVAIHTTQGLYTAEMMTKANAAKLQALFPRIPIENAEKAQHWYQDITKQAYIGTYTNDKDMQRDVEKAALYGWTPQTSAGVAGHVNVGRTATAAALTGGASLLFGASRSKDKITITFVRATQ